MIMFSFSAFAEEETPQPALSANDIEVTAGNNVTVYIRAENFVNVGAVDIFAFYDSAVFSVSSSSKQGIANSAQTAITTDVAGEACFSAVAPNGMNGSGYIWSITFKVKDNAKEGNYRIIFAAGDAYDIAFAPITVLSGSSAIKVNAKTQTIINKNLYIYSSGGYGQYKKGDKIQIDYYTSSANGMSAANFLLKYDPELLQPESITLNDKLKNSAGALYSLNDNAVGYRRLAYASLEGLNGYLPLLSVTFTVVGDIAVSSSTDVTLDVSGLYDISLSTITGMEVTNKIQLYTEQVDTRSAITLSEEAVNNSLLTLKITAPGETNLAAGDFVVNFDNRVWKCLSVNSVVDNCMVISNIKQDEGKVTFSFISEEGISKDTVLALLVFENIKCSKDSVSFSFVGKNLVNPIFEEIDAIYRTEIAAVMHSYLSQVVPPQFGVQGYTLYTCSACGHSYKDNYTDPLPYLLGDIDLDGDIDASDLTLLARHSAKIELITDLGALMTADINQDGEVTASDLTKLARHIAKIELIVQN